MRRRVIAAEVTTRLRHNPATVELGPREGLNQRCVVNCDNLVTVNQDDLVDYIATLDRTRLSEVEDALLFALGLR